MSWPERADRLLRGDPARPPWGLAIGCAVLSGAVVGGFGGWWGERAWQVAYSASKVPLLLICTVLISLPSFWLANTLMGTRSDFSQAVRGIVASQVGFALILLATAPLTLFWYASFGDYQLAVLFNALTFAVASLGAQRLLTRFYLPLIGRQAKHRFLLRIWLAIYAFVGIQLAWTLRPFVGSPDQPVAFFRLGEWENAYVVVARLVWGVLRRLA